MEDERSSSSPTNINCPHKCNCPAANEYKLNAIQIQKRLESLEEIVGKLVTWTNLSLPERQKRSGPNVNSDYFEFVQENAGKKGESSAMRSKDFDSNKIIISSNSWKEGSVAKKSTGGIKKRKMNSLPAGVDLNSELIGDDDDGSLIEVEIDIKPEPIDFGHGWEDNDQGLEMADFVLSPDDTVENILGFKDNDDFYLNIHPPKDDETQINKTSIFSTFVEKARLPNPYISLGPKYVQTNTQIQSSAKAKERIRYYCCLRKLGMCKKRLDKGSRIGQPSFRQQFNSYIEQRLGQRPSSFQDDELICHRHSLQVRAFGHPKFRVKKPISTPCPSIDLNAPRASRTRSKILQKESKVEFELEQDIEPSLVFEESELSFKSEDGLNSEEIEVPKSSTKPKKSVKKSKKFEKQSVSISRKGKYCCTKENCCFRTDKHYKMDFHLKNHIIVQPYLCEACGRSFRRRDHLKSHIRVHEKKDRPSFKCGVCSEEFHRQDSLNKHVNEKHKDQRRRCDICNGVYASKLSLYSHKQKMHNAKANVGGMCDLCGKVLKDPKSFQHHIQLHADPNFVPRAAKTHQRPLALSQDEDLVLDLDKIYDVPPSFVCDKEGCKWIGKKFATKLLYRYHINKHHLVGEERKVSCSLCSSVLKDISYLSSHMQNVHTTYRPHVCHICGQAFKLIQHLRRHVAGHSKPGWKPRKNSTKPYENKDHNLAEKTEDSNEGNFHMETKHQAGPSSFVPANEELELEQAVESINPDISFNLC